MVANVPRWLGQPADCSQAASTCLASAHPQAAREMGALFVALIERDV